MGRARPHFLLSLLALQPSGPRNNVQLKFPEARSTLAGRCESYCTGSEGRSGTAPSWRITGPCPVEDDAAQGAGESRTAV